MPDAPWPLDCRRGSRLSETGSPQTRARPRPPAPSAPACRISATTKCLVAPWSLLRRDHVCGIENAGVVDVRPVRIFVDALLDLVTEMRDQALDRPRRGVAERADGVALDLLCHLEQHVDLALVGATLGHSAQHPPHPPGV